MYSPALQFHCFSMMSILLDGYSYQEDRLLNLHALIIKSEEVNLWCNWVKRPIDPF